MAYKSKFFNESNYVNKKFVTATEAQAMYSVGHTKLSRLVEAAGASYKVGKYNLINTERLDLYLERFRERPVETK